VSLFLGQRYSRENVLREQEQPTWIDERFLGLLSARDEEQTSKREKDNGRSDRPLPVSLGKAIGLSEIGGVESSSRRRRD
jgi:hypothetical protein